ncbi:uncharacterized protein K02A2.6-like [Mercenaria mercenaria]|uniref:uncharacterized protein K02A2.6-like n=1 Tax=Mercenaria mercenaria TaxID=6596 RepID=UPI00234F3A85|nr:uncharacterized protein K02A2.6-like [Mercenaria mercenaria]
MRKKGHITPACKSTKNKAKVHTVECDSEEELYRMNSQSEASSRSIIWITPKIEGIEVDMELDTGAGVSVVNKEDVKKWWPQATLHETDLKLKTYIGEIIKPCGMLDVNVELDDQQAELKLYVVAKGSRPIFGREWLRYLKLNWSEIKTLQQSYNSGNVEKLMKSKYGQLFDGGLGHVKDVKATLKLKQDASPRFMKARPVPLALRSKIEKEVESLVETGVLVKVDHSDWATPIVPVPKSNGDIRICGDFKVTVNPQLEVDQYPLPRVEDIFASLGNGKKFSKIDLKNAYLQLEVDAESKKLLTINTHKGLFRYNRLVFGVAPAAAIFQRLIEQIVGDIPGVQVILDDMIITGSTDEEHLAHLEEVLQRLEKYGFKLNVLKCAFFQSRIEFCGHEIDGDGLHKTDEKVNAIVNAQVTNLKELRSFLGLVQYYAKFLPNLATVLHPLHQLLRKDMKWVWSKSCEEAVKRLYKKLNS